ncbi:MAG: hypothetical protein ACRDZ8_17140 [Acidimicrobiales bacterium]
MASPVSQVLPAGVEPVVFWGSGLATPAGHERRPGAQVVFGEIKAGRLAVFFRDRPTAGHSYVLTARPMTRREAGDYRPPSPGPASDHATFKAVYRLKCRVVVALKAARAIKRFSPGTGTRRAG